MRDDRERLQNILEAIGRIEKYASRGREAFQRDELIQNWMVRHLQIVGEAARAEEAREMAADAIRAYCASPIKHGEAIPSEFAEEQSLGG